MAKTVTLQLLVDEVPMLELLGSHDRLLRRLEREYPEVSMWARGNEVTLSGESDKAHRVKRLLEEFIGLVKNGVSLTPEYVSTSARLMDRDQPVTEILGEEVLVSDKAPVRAMSLGQKKYIEAMDRYEIVFAIGPAGTGKTYLAMARAIAALRARETSRLILTRPAVEAGERLGFLPGSLSEKIDPYLRPLYDALNALLDPPTAGKLIANGVVEVAPLAYMRGRTLEKAFVVLDEAQNTTREQMKMFLTRLGSGSRMVVTGDLTQQDLPTKKSGLAEAEAILKRVPGLKFCQLSSKDVVRHDLVTRIVEAYAQFHPQRPGLAD